MVGPVPVGEPLVVVAAAGVGGEGAKMDLPRALPPRASDPCDRLRVASAPTAVARRRRDPSEHAPPPSTKEATALLSLFIQTDDARRILVDSMRDDGIVSPLYMP